MNVHFERFVVDEKDLKILEVLQENSRLSFRQLAKKTGLSVATVISRVKRLEEMGIIKKYTVEINYSKLGLDFPVIIDVRVSKGKLFEVEEEIAKDPHVLAVYDITGDFDVAILARFRTRKELDKFVKELQKMKYVERTYTKLILNIIKETSGNNITKIIKPEETK